MTYAKWLIATAAVCACSLAAAPGARAQEDNGWRGVIIPYTGVYTVSGQSQFGNYKTPVDSRSGDYEAVLGATLAAWKGRWGGSVETWWTSSSDAGDLLNASQIVVQGERQASLLQGEAMVLFHALGPANKPFRALAGARYNHMKASARIFSSQTQFGNLDLSGSHTENWVDPFVGLLWMGNTEEKFWGAFRADVGGFGVGADVTWQIRATGALRVGEKADLTVGVRYMNIDYDNEESGTDHFAHDAEHGAFLFGVVIRTP